MTDDNSGLFFASTVLEGDTELDAASRFFVGAAENIGQMLQMLTTAFDQEEAKLVLLRKATAIEKFNEGDFDAAIDFAPVKEMGLKPGHIIAGDPFPGSLEAALPQTGAYIALIDLVTTNGFQLSLICVAASDAVTALRIILDEAESGGAQIRAIEGLMDASLHSDEAYGFKKKPTELVAALGDGMDVTYSDVIDYT